jgi:hypothetical protein
MICPVTMPLVGDADDTVATAAPPAGRFGDVHVAVSVTSRVEPSLYVPVAVYCWVPETGIVVVFGVTAIDTSLPAGFSQVPPPTPPQPDRILINKLIITKQTRDTFLNIIRFIKPPFKIVNYTIVSNDSLARYPSHLCSPHV